MKRKMFVICTSIAALHLVVGGAVMLGGCTGVQEDEPMPRGAYIPSQTQTQEQPKEAEAQTTKTEPKTPETVDQPVVDDPVVVDEPVIEKPVEPAKVEKPVVTPPPAKKTPAPKPVRENDIEYIIKKGDTYSKVSLEYGVPLKDLMAYNPYPEKKLIPGRKMMIPATGKKITQPVAAPVKVQKSYEAMPEDGVYVVKKNDNYSKIASRFGLRASDIAEYNNLPLTKAIQPGQKLRLPPRRVTPKSSAVKPAAKTPAGKPAAKTPAGKPAAKTPAAPVQDDELEDVTPPILDNIKIPDASISNQTPDVVMTEVITEDTTVAKLANEYASSEKEILKRNPHLSADGIVKRGTKVVL